MGISDLSSTFTGIANAIRSKTGSSSAFTPAQMVTEIENIPTDKVATSYIGGNKYSGSTITSYTGNEDLILDYAFYRCISLSTVSFPECEYIGYYAFYNCTNLINISFPECSYIENYAFASCTSLSTVSFPMCSYIGSNAFQRCTNLINISFPECSYIGYYAFSGCTSLTNISFPMCSYIDNYAFQRCTSLSSLYLLSTSIVSLANSNAFDNTPLSAGGTGSIYVPSSLVTTYKTATNWSYISNRITSYNG